MEQFRQIGEVLGSLKALLVFRDNIQINQRQCLLLFDIFSSAFDSMAEEMRLNLRFEEKSTIKWRILEQPLRELYGIFREGEAYVKQCLETKDWWAKAISLHHNSDCVEFHIHNLLSCVPVVIEAIETTGEISGFDQDEMRKKKRLYSSKYVKEYRDWKLFQWKFGKQYVVSQEFCNRFDIVRREDKWVMLNKFRENKNLSLSKNEQRLIDFLFESFDGSEPFSGKLLPSSVLVKSKDYQVRRRLGGRSQYKEIIWFGESFVSRHFFGDPEPLLPEISSLLSLSHPNIVNFLCGFADEEKKDWLLVMELMSKDLSSYIKENSGPRKRIPFSLPVTVDLMLQIARGMEYLHLNRISHGDLSPSNILVRARSGRISTEGSYLLAKVSGFGLTSVRSFTQKGPSNQNETLSFIWYAPEVLEEQQQTGTAENSKYTEKSDVYSFGMVCFELLTGKVPFEDSHLQGDKMSRNIRAGERPLFPFQAPKYVTNLTKKCWHADPNQRPSFSSICRILRYIKRFLALNPDYSSQQDPPVPLHDYFDIESSLSRNSPSWGSTDQFVSVSKVPFQMFVFRSLEKEKTISVSKDNSEESARDVASICGDEGVITVDDPFPSTPERKSLSSSDSMNKRISLLKRSSDAKMNKPGLSLALKLDYA
ncbi:Tyrosine-protein kinase [Parasponia andersonii]|uniref:Tyrosine-protein kinase n=1 Tax=Parasponia andersonii TaxID=3476 RepID=A0A2P5DDD8_PARAD|nr:Tyrosine-protein kinase [Parasponia andersonii]